MTSTSILTQVPSSASLKRGDNKVFQSSHGCLHFGFELKVGFITRHIFIFLRAGQDLRGLIYLKVEALDAENDLQHVQFGGLLYDRSFVYGGEIGLLGFPTDLGQSHSLARVCADTDFYGLVYAIKSELASAYYRL